MYGKLNKFVKEIQLLGFQGTINRSVFEIKRRIGIDVFFKKIKIIDFENYLNNCLGDFSAKCTYRELWLGKKPEMGISDATRASEYLLQLLSTEQKNILKDKASNILKGKFQQFGHSWVQYDEVDWFCHPEEGITWPYEHSSKLLLQLAKYGDIKLVWEIGRFTWVFDLIRAWLIDKNSSYLDFMFYLIDDFSTKNPLYIGPQWTSEQEVAIRALMLIYVQEVLKDEQFLTEERLLKLHSLLELHAIYLDNDLDYAEIAIRNNHLIHGALGLYVISSALPWHKKSPKWHEKSKRILIEAANEQWYTDGGYVQPSHNYHRSAWHGMLWARMVATQRGDKDLILRINANISNSLSLFQYQIDDISGQMPNWGPNDGALIGSWTECDYSDFRPLVQVLSLIESGNRAFVNGLWDEEAFWFLGETEFNYKPKLTSLLEFKEFDQQGLSVIQRKNNDFSVFRCGTPLSRYGQQADQLHVDIWRAGKNIAIDAGSYNYNRCLSVHNWFRGTFSHNTVIIDEVDQMIPHRTFKYLSRVKAISKKFDIPMGTAVIGVHNGYNRLDGEWCHARVLANINDKWVILDRLWPLIEDISDASLRLHWQFSDVDLDLDEKHSILHLNTKDTIISFFCSDSTKTISQVQSNDSPLDGWHSRYYNNKQPATALNIKVLTNHETWFVTVVGASYSMIDIVKDSVFVDEKQVLSIDYIRNFSNDLISGIINDK